MPARNGASYIDSLKQMNPSVYLDGKVDSVIDHPAFAGVIRSYADLYDMQEGEKQDVLTLRKTAPATPRPSLCPNLPMIWSGVEARRGSGPNTRAACLVGPGTT